MKNKICEICQSDFKVQVYTKTNQLLCNKHRIQMSTKGEIKERTNKDKNIIIIYDDYAEIILEDKNCKERARAIISIESIEIIKKYKWRLVKYGYVRTNIKGKSLGLHKILMNSDENNVVDHINRNPLDNRIENLRICPQSKNLINKGIQSNNTSKITGVWFDKSRNKWASELQFNKKKIFFKRFDSKEEAIIARKNAELEYFGEYNPINRYKKGE